jgi:hypothetical protein
VLDGEVVLAALFEEMQREGRRLSRNSFSPKQLKRAQVSVARKAHINCQTFMQCIVAPGTATKGEFLGAAPAAVSKLRGIKYRVEGAQPPIEGRAICVLDKVTEGDHDSHAVLAFSTTHETLKEPWKKKLRPFILEDVTGAFDAAMPIEQVLSS